jgi:predicted S18 family serine protease
LNTAKNDRTKGFPAAALFEALEALSKSNLALELIDGLTEDKLERYKESAVSSISESRLRGIEPVLAVSYFEYAQSLLNESSTDAAVFYYKYSSLIPGVLTFTGQCGSQSSRYYGIPEFNVSLWSSFLNINNFKNMLYLAFFSLIIFLVGVIFGFGITYSTTKKKDNFKNNHSEVKKYQIYNTRNISNEHTSKEELPKSIKDYYRNEKQ